MQVNRDYKDLMIAGKSDWSLKASVISYQTATYEDLSHIHQDP